MAYLRNGQSAPPSITQTVWSSADGKKSVQLESLGGHRGKPRDEPAPAPCFTPPQLQPHGPVPQSTPAVVAPAATRPVSNNQPPAQHMTLASATASAFADNSGGDNPPPTTVAVQTVITTTGVFTTDITTTLANGIITSTEVTSSGTRTHTPTTTTELPTQIGILSAKTGPPKALIGGVIGATIIPILALVAFLILRRRRKRVHLRTITANHQPSILTQTSTQEVLEINPQSPAVRTSLIRPRPFLELEPSQPVSTPEPKVKERLQLSSSSRQQEDQNPFRDPEVAGIPEARNDEGDAVERARDALDRLQQLTSQLEAEFGQLNNLARLGQLSDEDRVRLEEIRRNTGLTIPFNPRQGHLSTDSSASGHSVPPSYHSDFSG